MSLTLAETPLHALHLRLGARMAPFAGYTMPVSYPPGSLAEHRQTRNAAGLFDVSHMGQIALTPRGGSLADLALALEAVLPVDVAGLAPGRQRYAMLTSDTGGILDDLMVANLGDRLLLVVNAACKATDEAWIRARLGPRATVAALPNALVALQGPGAEAALLPLMPEAAAMTFLDVRATTILGAPCIVSRSGYTGEDGFEIAVPADRVEALAEALLADGTVMPIGLAARDSLRLEAGLCLSGSDFDAATSPVEAGLTWAISPVRRRGGARAGGFPGADRVLAEIASGAPRRRVGLRPSGRVPVRAGAPLFLNADDAAPVGTVTSGGFGASLEAPVAMGFLPTPHAAAGTTVFAEVRGQRLPLVVTTLPFVPNRFKRPA